MKHPVWQNWSGPDLIGLLRFMFGRGGLVGLIGLLCLLSGCKTITLDEAFVFQPGQFGDANAPRLSIMRYERVFSAPTDMTINVWADGQTAQHIITSEGFVPSDVRHESIPYGGESLAITSIQRPGEARPLVLHCGGNASDRYESGTLYAQKIIPFADVLMFDYPGYGDSTGQADADSLRAANFALAKYLNSDFAQRRPLILWGHSLGGFVCADMAARLNAVDGIILEATATNAQDVSKAVIPWYAKLFIKPRVSESLSAYDMVETLEGINVPILILGAAKDKTLPVNLSRNLSEGLMDVGKDVTYAEFPNANHISIPVQDRFPATINAFVSALDGETRKIVKVGSSYPQE